ncbi:translation initiation factor IF-5A [Candidatus Woesearchaeota archaeon]|nr:translation initiation factor IF-5A [Candidatus Woesearchaeota archaeon]
MTTKLVAAGSIKEGSFIVVDGAACKVAEATHSKSGKHGSAKMRFIAIGVLDNKKRDIVIPASDNIEVPLIEKKSAQVLSVSGNTANVMDIESYETFDLNIPEELKDQVIEGCQVLYWVILDEKVMKQVKSGSE